MLKAFILGDIRGLIVKFIYTLFLGVQSIQSEDATMKAKLLQENQQIQETYSEQIKDLQSDLKNCKQQLSIHADSKKALENQIEKLKKEVVKKINTQRNLTERLKDKEIELEKYHQKIFEVILLTSHQNL